MNRLDKLNNKWLHNDYFYLLCNGCERLIEADEMSEDLYEHYDGYCPQCAEKMGF